MPGAVANPKKGGKGPHEQEDAFVRAIDRTVAWVRSNTVTVVVCAVAIGLLAAGGLWWTSYQRNLEERATQRLTALRSQIASGQSADPTGGLETFLERFGGTEAATEARIVLARELIASGRGSEAISTIRPAVESSSPDTPTGYATRRLLARAHEASGETGPALDVLDELAEEARFAFERRTAAAERARILREEGRLEEALAIYDRLAAEAAESETASLYAVRAGEIRGMMAGGTPGADGAGPGGGDAGTTTATGAPDSGSP